LNADFFRNFGLYVAREFFDGDLCARLRAEARGSAADPATVRKRAADYEVDEQIRRTQLARVSEATEALVELRLLTLKGTLERHFGVTTTGIRWPQFLVYREGDFFCPHADSSADADAPPIATTRRVSIVIFVNGEGSPPDEDSYSGGSLTFYGLMNDPRADDRGFPLTAETGLLVAFPSHYVHSVAPVTRGMRFTIVSWLEGAAECRT
jgi:predicted 2-oxoglutarate/Fe(II)-dependent dioxygenase YbiX